MANLRPIAPGEVRNPRGINRRRPITDRYYEWSESMLPEAIRRKINKEFHAEILKEGATWADATAARQFHEAVMKGSTAAAKEIREAIEGRSPQRQEVIGPERKEVTIRVVYEDRNEPDRLGPNAPTGKQHPLLLSGTRLPSNESK